MNQYPLHKAFIYNGQIKPNHEFLVSENAGGVYEVIRVIQSVPIFAEEHLERFFVSARLANYTIPFSKQEIARFLSQLTAENEVSEGNILLSYKFNLKAFFISHKYPDERWFSGGVTCGVLHAERDNPNAKVFQTSVRQRADDMMEKEGYYEVLLVDHSGRITEGSRSNVFFVSGNQLFTPPGNEVLLGITRLKTIQLAKDLNIPFFEQEIKLNQVNSFDAAFITGTSPKILPLSHINGRSFDAQNYVVQQLVKKYDELINQYVSLHKNKNHTT